MNKKKFLGLLAFTALFVGLVPMTKDNDAYKVSAATNSDPFVGEWFAIETTNTSGTFTTQDLVIDYLHTHYLEGTYWLAPFETTTNFDDLGTFKVSATSNRVDYTVKGGTGYSYYSDEGEYYQFYNEVYVEDTNFTYDSEEDTIELDYRYSNQPNENDKVIKFIRKEKYHENYKSFYGCYAYADLTGTDVDYHCSDATGITKPDADAIKNKSYLIFNDDNTISFKLNDYVYDHVETTHSTDGSDLIYFIDTSTGESTYFTFVYDYLKKTFSMTTFTGHSGKAEEVCILKESSLFEPNNYTPSYVSDEYKTPSFENHNFIDWYYNDNGVEKVKDASPAVGRVYYGKWDCDSDPIYELIGGEWMLNRQIIDEVIINDISNFVMSSKKDELDNFNSCRFTINHNGRIYGDIMSCGEEGFVSSVNDAEYLVANGDTFELSSHGTDFVFYYNSTTNLLEVMFELDGVNYVNEMVRVENYEEKFHDNFKFNRADFIYNAVSYHYGNDYINAIDKEEYENRFTLSYVSGNSYVLVFNGEEYDLQGTFSNGFLKFEFTYNNTEITAYFCYVPCSDFLYCKAFRKNSNYFFNFYEGYYDCSPLPRFIPNNGESAYKAATPVEPIPTFGTFDCWMHEGVKAEVFENGKTYYATFDYAGELVDGLYINENGDLCYGNQSLIDDEDFLTKNGISYDKDSATLTLTDSAFNTITRGHSIYSKIGINIVIDGEVVINNRATQDEDGNCISAAPIYCEGDLYITICDDSSLTLSACPDYDLSANKGYLSGTFATGSTTIRGGYDSSLYMVCEDTNEFGYDLAGIYSFGEINISHLDECYLNCEEYTLCTDGDYDINLSYIRDLQINGGYYFLYFDDCTFDHILSLEIVSNSDTYYGIYGGDLCFSNCGDIDIKTNNDYFMHVDSLTVTHCDSFQAQTNGQYCELLYYVYNQRYEDIGYMYLEATYVFSAVTDLSFINCNQVVARAEGNVVYGTGDLVIGIDNSNLDFVCDSYQVISKVGTLTLNSVETYCDEEKTTEFNETNMTSTAELHSFTVTQTTFSQEENLVNGGEEIHYNDDYEVIIPTLVEDGSQIIECTYFTYDPYYKAIDENLDNKPTEVGEYAVLFKINEGDYFKKLLCPFSIVKANYDLSGISFSGKTVNVSDPDTAKVLSITGTLPEGLSVVYENNNNTEIGEYTVTARFINEDSNYNTPEELTAVLKIIADTPDGPVTPDTPDGPVTPDTPAPEKAPSFAWLIILICVLAAAGLGFLGYYFFKKYKGKKTEQK